MSDRRIVAPLSIAFAAGAALWTAAAMLSGKREAWDATVYWALAYPVALLVCALLGAAWPDRPWRWALVLFEAQFVAMVVRSGELGGLWPLGMAMFAILAAPGIVAARLAARRGGRAAGGRAA